MPSQIVPATVESISRISSKIQPCRVQHGEELDQRLELLRQEEIALQRAWKKTSDINTYHYLDSLLRRVRDEMAQIEIVLDHGQDWYVAEH